MSGDGCGQRPHPVLLERLARPAGRRRRKPSGPRRRVAGAESDRRERSLRHAGPPCCWRRPARCRSPARAAARRRPRGARGSTARRRGWRARRPARPTPARLELDRLRSDRLGSGEVARPIGQRRAQHRDARGHRRAALQERPPVVGRGRRVRPALGGRGLAGVEASQARARQSRGSPSTRLSGSASSQRATVALRPVCSAAFQDAAIRSAAASAGRAASRCATAVETSPARGKPGAGARVQLGDVLAGTRPSSSRRSTRGRRGGSGTTRGARRAGRGKGSPARYRQAAASTCPRRARRRRRRAEAVEHARVDEEPASLRRLRREDLVAEVVDEMAVVAEVVGVPWVRWSRSDRPAR